MNRKSKRLRTIIPALVVVFACGVALTLYKTRHDNNAVTPSSDGESINYAPPTDQEKNQGNVQKEHTARDEARQNDTDTSTAKSQKVVSVVITDASQYDDIIEVRAFVPNYYQDGTCTITFTKDGKTISKNSPAYKDISSTICTNPKILRAEFSLAGEWKVTVSYESKDSSAHGSKSQSIVIK